MHRLLSITVFLFLFKDSKHFGNSICQDLRDGQIGLRKREMKKMHT